MMLVCAIVPAYSASLLQPASFPKTIDDLSFQDKYALLAEGYKEFDRIYDSAGNCISGCPYAGMTLAQDQQNVDDATAAYEDVLAQLDLDDDSEYENEYENDDYDEAEDEDENDNDNSDIANNYHDYSSILNPSYQQSHRSNSNSQSNSSPSTQVPSW